MWLPDQRQLVPIRIGKSATRSRTKRSLRKSAEAPTHLPEEVCHLSLGETIRTAQMASTSAK